MKISEANDLYKGKRVAVLDEDGEWHGGVLSYITTNSFPEHGIVAYYGRGPIYNINLDSMFEFQDALSYMEGKEKFNPA